MGGACLQGKDRNKQRNQTTKTTNIRGLGLARGAQGVLKESAWIGLVACSVVLCKPLAGTCKSQCELFLSTMLKQCTARASRSVKLEGGCAWESTH